MESSRKADLIKNELPREREAPYASGPAKGSPPSWVCRGEEGFSDERRAKGTNWVARHVFQVQRDYPSRFFYCYIIVKWVLLHFFSPSSLEGGRFSSHCRSVNSACRDGPARPCQGRPSSPRGDNLGCAHGIFYDYFLGSGHKTTSTELALNLLSRTQRLLKTSFLLTFPVSKERRK